ncbi:PTS system D-fructose-specific IIB component (F1P-forming), Frc family /PTS system D-fructose-specific IIC component (F1P-forming), Frc family [Actinokineospora alba]|uniref:PTS system D-fructose-specific IIB component (F1P-forming), Frc family /PTS system D-fructose-specific IIC component (F1P-forming), Frc family n=1 Tax=Actinokineospora alba TaxID=504798 RepID=A0A1H0K2B2_9PSEU|nr:fructose-specific PTS transporter subunit EIIC [Actinokineospora alba]TDP68075.1 PTS system D-fructose-specific IIB component (F1P-forming) (Frc family) /PTS system D-fructose-specific IIC component (F1P-forming) (Frc family) [Actinokineospora alba]SDH91931.1 PTS system, fructose-specific IIC component [Actinokineospora alba]SDO49999.1 PTS system D-fructose-specific IIB component (F1P-forming), Frc family /PTS system D-fructose-specific IIC component (F1P-forming), Frc family [Actinokineospor
MKLVAVTSCPTGIAHTYMAAEALEQAAKDAGHELLVETQGSAGMDPLSPQDIADARAVIFAADVEVRERDRFAGKPLVQAGVKQAINNPGELIAQAVGRAADGPSAVLVSKVDESGGVGTRLRQWLMTGVSYMIPFVAAGGLLIALAFLFGGAEVANKVNGGTFGGVEYAGVTDLSQLFATAGLPGVLFKIGAVAFSMLVPILAGFIAFAIADRPGLVPGVVGGLLATATGAGFLGGLLAGLLAGGVAYALTRISLPRALQAVMPVVIVPLISTAVVGTVMLLVIGSPVAAVQTGLTDWLTGMTGTGAVALGLLLGAMMAFDMGGPVNKVAYTFAVGTLASGTPSAAMAAVMAAGMVPPLGLALATVIRRKLFTDAERKAGEAGWLLGASFITEGAIPFAAADPLRVIPSIVLGSAATGGLTMLVGATSLAPHGGIWVVGLIGKPLFVVLAIAVGTVITAVCVLAAKSLRGSEKSAVAAVPATV